MNVIKYRKTRPKLKTSDLNGLLETIFLLFILINYGAKNGTVPNIVAYYRFSPVTTLQLPTSHNFNAKVVESIIRIFYGFMSQ